MVAKVARRQLSETLDYVGQTVAVNDVSLRAQVEGYRSDMTRTLFVGEPRERKFQLLRV